MNIKIFFILLFASLAPFVQGQQNPNVELPDFVITGRDIVSIQKAKKMKPELVPTVSKDFFNPNFSPDDLGIQDILNPISSKLNLLDTLNNYNGYLELGMGVYTLPKAKAVYSIPFTNGIFNSYFNGNNTLNYVNDIRNSSSSEWNGGANLTYFVDNDVSFLGGTKINLHGNYGVKSYKFYGSDIPGSKRSLNTGDFSFGINNLVNKNFIIDAKISNRYTYLPKEASPFSENLLNLSAYTAVNFSSFNLSADFNFKNQYLNSSNTGYFNVRPLAGLNISSLIKVKFGFNYAETSSRHFLAPYGSIGIQFNKNLSLFGEIDPHAEFVTNGDFLRENHYNIPAVTPDVFLKKKFALNAILKYEYDRYFEIDGGVDYYNAESLPYFVTANDTGRFGVALTASGVNSYSAFINLLFHPGPYGVFYGNVKLNSTKDSDGHIIPYYPQTEASLVYGFDMFDKALNTSFSLNYYSKQYMDIKNTQEINPYFDMGLKFKYLLFSQFRLTFELLNLFNNDNYRWNNIYKEPTLNAVGGFSYQW